MPALGREVRRVERVRQLETGRVEHPFELMVLALSLLMLPAVVIQDSLLHSPWGAVADGLGAFVVGGVLMVVGIGFLGTATAAIASHFVNTDATKQHREVSDKHRETLARHTEILAELKAVNERLGAIEKK